MHRFELPNDLAEYSDWFGLDLADWDNYSYGKALHAICIYDQDNVHVYAQDAYSAAALLKLDYIWGTMKQTTGNDADNTIAASSWVYNYTSSAMLRPLETSRKINPGVFNDSLGFTDNRRLGIVMFNFVDAPMARLIYETNKSDSNFYETKVQKPQVSITYGQSLSQATLSGGSSDGKWTFADGDYVPDFSDYDSGKTFEITYTPSNSSLKPVTEEVSIDEFHKKNISVTVDDQEITYGDALPEWTCSFDRNELVGDDTEADLGLVLELENQSGDEPLDAGQYVITGSDSSDNYSVTFDDGKLTVKQKTVGIRWSDTGNLVYTGEPVNVTAELTGVLDGDDCSPVIEGGSETEPSWDGTSSAPQKYTAKITALDGADKDNYSLPDDTSQLTYSYRIRRLEPNVTFPDSAEVTYGETLDQAVFSGGSGDGQFCFSDEVGGKLLTVADSGTEYELQFIPADAKNYTTVTGKVPVTVNPKPVTVEIDDKEKTYGQSTPEYIWHMDESQLVGTDSVDDFEIKLTAGEGDDQTCDARLYRITGSVIKQNNNYEVTFHNGKLTVDPLAAEVIWSSTVNIQVGDSEPSASIANLVGSDDCTLVVESDGTSEPSWTADDKELKIFHAKIIGLGGMDRSNYILPDDGIEIQYLVRREDADDYNMPAQVVMTYGETYGEAEMVLASEDGVFTIVDKTGKDISGQSPDNAGTSTCMVKYTPTDSTQKPVLQEAELLVEPKPVTAFAENGEKIYGEKTELTFTMDEGQLVKQDTIDGLGLTLTAVNTEGSDKPDGDSANSPAGTYTIEKKSCDNKNYDVTVVPATYWIRQKTVSVVWSDVSDLYYTGEPVNVTATASPDDLVNGDEAKVTVLNGTQTEVGTYRAIAQSITNDNYRLDNTEEGVENRIKEYTIRQGVPEVTFPQKAVVRYGEPLASAVLTGQSGDGTFRFKEPGTMLSVSQSGSTQTMVFTPDDTKNYKTIEQDVKVEVLPIRVSLEWYGAELRVYDGKPSDVRAAAVGLLAGDEAEVEVKNGTQTEPGTYVAEAVSISNENYRLPKSESERQQQYTILVKSSDGDKQGDDDSTNNDNGVAAAGSSGTSTGDPFGELILPIFLLMTAAAIVMVMLLIARKEKNVHEKNCDN